MNLTAQIAFLWEEKTDAFLSAYEGHLAVANHNYGLCSSSLLLISQTINQSNIEEDRNYFIYFPRWPTITEGSEGRNLKKPWRNVVCCLVHRLLISWLWYTFQGHQHREWCNQWAGILIAINNQDNLPRMCSLANVIWTISQLWLHSQVTPGGVIFTVEAK